MAFASSSTRTKATPKKPPHVHAMPADGEAKSNIQNPQTTRPGGCAPGLPFVRLCRGAQATRRLRRNTPSPPKAPINSSADAGSGTTAALTLTSVTKSLPEEFSLNELLR